MHDHGTEVQVKGSALLTCSLKVPNSLRSSGLPRFAMINSTEPRAYSLTARVLHWSTAILVLTVLPLGVVIGNEWGGPLQDQLYDLHRSIGATILLLVVVRLGYRLTHPPLPLPDHIPPSQRFAAQATHCAL